MAALCYFGPQIFFSVSGTFFSVLFWVAALAHVAVALGRLRSLEGATTESILAGDSEASLRLPSRLVPTLSRRSRLPADQ